MSSFTTTARGWARQRTMDELLDDPLAEEVYGLFLMVKDSPRHVAISPERLINDAYGLCSLFFNDKHAEEHLEEYAHEITNDLGWHYAADLVMAMAYHILCSQKKLPKRMTHLLQAMERAYGLTDYWTRIACGRKRHKDSGRKPKVLTLDVLKQYASEQGKQTVVINLQVEQADIKVLSPGNTIAKEIKYGEQQR